MKRLASLCLSLPLSLLVFGCSSEDPLPAGVPATGNDFEEFPADDGASELVTEYEVPVPPGLEDYAYFSMGKLPMRHRDDGEVRLDYKLPVDLTAEPRVKINLEGVMPAPGQPLILRGNRGEARCTQNVESGRWTCMVAYRDLGIDLERTMAHLDTVYDAEELGPRGEVAGIFTDDPLGLIHNLAMVAD